MRAVEVLAPGAELELEQLDLASLESVRRSQSACASATRRSTC